MTIYKYILEVEILQKIKLPLNSEILTVQAQGEDLCLWAKIEEKNTDTEERIIEVFGTGHPMGNEFRRYIGTAQMHNGALVWHVFERDGHEN